MKLLDSIKELSNDSIYYGLSSVLSQLISLFLVPFYTRELDPETYGIILMLSVVITFMIPISGLSIDGGFIRFYSFAKESDKHKYFSTSIALKCFGLILTSFIVLFFFSFINRELFENKLSEIFKIYLILMIFFETLSMLFFSFLRVQRKVKKILYVNIFSLSIGLFFSILLVIILKWGLNGAVIATIIGSSSKFIILAVMILRADSFQFSKNIYKELLTYSLPKIPHKIFLFIITFSTTLFINETLGLITAGIYFISLKITKPLGLITNVFQQAWVPFRLDIHKLPLNEKKLLFKNISSIYLNSLIILWLIISLFTPEIYQLLIDVRYHEGIRFVPFLILVPLSTAFYYMFITGYELHDNQKLIMYASMSVSSLQLFLSYYFMYYFAPFNFIFFHILSYVLLSLIIKKWSNQIIIFDFNFLPLILNFLSNALIIYLSYKLHFSFFIKFIIVVFFLSILYFFTKRIFKNNVLNEK